MLPLVSILIFLPLFGGIITLFSGKNARQVSMAVAIAELVVSLWVIFGQFVPAAGVQLEEHRAVLRILLWAPVALPPHLPPGQICRDRVLDLRQHLQVRSCVSNSYRHHRRPYVFPHGKGVRTAW